MESGGDMEAVEQDYTCETAQCEEAHWGEERIFVSERDT